jgi:hypothetical protein
MRNVLDLVSRFRERAAECVQLAELTNHAELVRDYCYLANCYMLLAENELRRAEEADTSLRLCRLEYFRPLRYASPNVGHPHQQRTGIFVRY